MYLTIKKNLILTVVVSISPAYAIQESTAKIGAGIVAIISSAGSYSLMREFPGKFSSLAFVGGTAVMTVGCYYILHRATPAGRIKRANVMLNEIARHTLARMSFSDEASFFDAVHDIYLTDDLPLISAYNHLLSIVPDVHYALSLINKASAEVGRDVLLEEECDASLSRANTLFKNISDALKRIRSHKDYLAQLNLYKENILHEKQTIAQEQIAVAHTQIAYAQQSSTFLKWLKAIFFGK